MTPGGRAAHHPARTLLLPAILLAALLCGPGARAQSPVVRAVLFFLPTCGHCEYVINDWLFPVWFPRYGGEPVIRWDESLGDEAAFYLGTNGTLEILFVNTQLPAGAELFAASNEPLGLPPDQRGVPRLVVGNGYLVGSVDIPEQFPAIVEAGLASGGIDWPDLPGLPEALASIPAAVPPTTTTEAEVSTTTSPEASTTTEAATPTLAPATTATTGGGALPLGGDAWGDRFRRDPVANSLALVVLLLMAGGAAGAAARARRSTDIRGPGPAVALLALLGLGVAAYLAFVEVSGSAAVCGPVGDCNTVQDSPWARVFGVVPVGVIGVAGYSLVLVCWGLARFGPARVADRARMALLAGVAGGVGFSMYLTFLEPFVIGASCLWCLSSAVIVTLLLWLTAAPGAAAWRRRRGAPSAGEGGGGDRRRGPGPAPGGPGTIEVFD